MKIRMELVIGRAAAVLVAVAAVAAVGCGPRGGGKGGEGPPPGPAKVLVVEWSVDRVGPESQEPPRTAVGLTLTDETGSARVESLGEVTGACNEWGRADLARYPGTLLGLHCFYAGAGVEFRVVHSADSVVVLRMVTDEQSEDGSFEEHRSFPVPPGTGVRTQP